MTDFRHEKPERARGEKRRDSHDHGGGDHRKSEQQRPHPKKHDTYKSDARSLYVMATRRERQRLSKEVVAKYAVGHMAIQGSLN